MTTSHYSAAPRPSDAHVAKPGRRHLVALDERASPIDGPAMSGHARKTHARRGEIWQVVADPAQPSVGTEIWSNRPAVVLSNNISNERAGFAVIVYLSTSSHKLSGPMHVQLPPVQGTKPSIALCEQLHTVDASRLVRKLGEVPAGRIRDLDAAVTMSLSLGRNPDTFGLFRKWESHIKLNGIDLAAEIAALSGKTADERVEALQRALDLVTRQRDAYRDLLLTDQELPAALHEVAETIGAPSTPSDPLDAGSPAPGNP